MVTLSGFSQSSSRFRADLQALDAILKETPSYKEQIRGKALVEYKKLYDSLSSIEGDNLSSLDYFATLSHLFFPIRDNHLGFYEVFDVAAFADTVSYRKFKATLETSDYPMVGINIDSLKRTLLQKGLGEVEGVYYYEKFYSFGIYKTAPNQYQGVIIDSDVSFWKKGEIVAKLYAYAPNHFRAVYANPLTKKFTFYPNEKFRNESLINSYLYPSFSKSNYKKVLNEVDFVDITETTPAFQLKKIRNDIQYLRLGNFSAFPKMMVDSDQFYQSIKDSLSAKNLIVDLRNNTGGAEKVSKKFLTLIKKHARNARIYVLVNSGTLSQGEIFLLQLMEIKNVATYGQTTQGKIAYGSNYGKREKLPSEHLEVYITDMKDKLGLLKYENKGIEPGMTFINATDWLDQIMSVIDAQ
jgi:hypothetical protein